MFYPSARYGVKHKTTSTLIFSTLYKYFSDADYTRIRVQKNYGGSIDPLTSYFMRGFASFNQCMQHSDSLSSLSLSLSLSLSRSLSLVLSLSHSVLLCYIRKPDFLVQNSLPGPGFTTHFTNTPRIEVLLITQTKV